MASFKGLNANSFILSFFYITQHQQVVTLTTSFLTGSKPTGTTPTLLTSNSLNMSSPNKSPYMDSTVARTPISNETSAKPLPITSILYFETTTTRSNTTPRTFSSPEISTTFKSTITQTRSTFELTTTTTLQPSRRTPTTVAVNSTISGTSPTSTVPGNPRNDVGMIIGIVVGALFVVGLVIGGALFYRKRLKNRAHDEQPPPTQPHYDQGTSEPSSRVIYANSGYDGNVDLRPPSDIVYANMAPSGKLGTFQHTASNNDNHGDMPIYSNALANSDGESPDRFQPPAGNNINSQISPDCCAISDTHIYGNVILPQTRDPEYVNMDRKLTTKANSEDIYETPIGSTSGIDKR